MSVPRTDEVWGDFDMWEENWVPRAVCRGTNPDALFVRGAAQHQAKKICGACPVKSECLAEALDGEMEWGVWGGLTERERRALLKQRPAGAWRPLLMAAKEGAVAASA